jgi:hypothetical protein
MMQFRRWGLILVAPALGAFLLALGCGGGDNKTSNPPAGEKGVGSDKGHTPPDSGTTSTGAKSALEAKYTATVKGTVTYDGTPPKPNSLRGRMEEQADKSHCLSKAAEERGDTVDPTWMVNSSNKGVANVVVFLKAPADKYFAIPEADRTRKDAVVIDQPFCAFEPHVVAVNPSTWDPATKKQKKTGEVLKVQNSAPIAHNTHSSGDSILNPDKNNSLPAKKEGTASSMELPLKPCNEGQVGRETLVNLSCDIHKWMTGRIAVFDHPYFAVTDKDGKYEIKNAPAGVDVTLAYWHESMSPNPAPTALNQAKKETVKLNEGDNTKDFTIK